MKIGSREIWRAKAAELFGLDLRSLALFRIGLAALVIGDLIDRARFLSAHYGDMGVLPRWVLFRKFAGPWELSFHALSGRVEFQAVLFLLNGAFALALLVGYRTRLSTVVCWAFLVSLHYRNDMVLQSGDSLLRMLFFWSIFLPLGARFSRDAAGIPSAAKASNGILSAASLALTLQVCLVYWITAALKDAPAWRDEGNAVLLALSIDQLTSPFGRALRQFPEFLKILNFATLGLEFVGPALLFVPVFTSWIRLAVIVAFIWLHAGLAVCFAIGMFPFISIVSWLALIPGAFWDHFRPGETGLAKRIRKWDERGRDVFARWRGSGAWRKWIRLGGQAFVLFCLGYVLLWNVRSLDAKKYRVLPSRWNWFGYVLHLDQYWGMFAPYPTREDGWYVIPATLADGSEVDLFRDGATVRWEKPPADSFYYPNQRWQKYMMNLWKKSNGDYRLHYATYLCRQWNAAHEGGKALETFKIYFMKETTRPDGKEAEPEKNRLWRHHCASTPPKGW